MSADSPISGDEHRYIRQAEKVLKYFDSNGENKAAVTQTSIDPQHYNAQFFDNAIQWLNNTFRFKNIFEFRHLVNALFAWAGIITTGLFILSIAGPRSALFGIVLLTFTPRFFGHGLTNHRDIPAIVGMIGAIYLLHLVLQKKWNTKLHLKLLMGFSLAIALCFSIRLSHGILTIFYSGAFYLLWLIFNYSQKNKKKNKQKKKFRKSTLEIKELFKKSVLLGIAIFIGFLLGNSIWPFFLEDPFNNTLEVFKASSEFGVGLKQLFEGKLIFSFDIPLYYHIKMFALTTPMVIFLGLILFLTSPSFSKFYNENKAIFYFLIFSILFPLTYATLRVSNDYGGIRHFLFVFPFFVIAASIGINESIKCFFRQHSKIAYSFLFILMLHPVIFVFASHPYQYIYYNELAGGVKKAFPNYMTDYGLLGLKGASDKLINYINENVPATDTVVVATNDYDKTQHYFRNIKNVKVTYTRYYDRYYKDWDYGVFACAYISPDERKEGGGWPAFDAIDTLNVCGAPIAYAAKRVSKEDFAGFQALNNGNPALALQYFQNYLKSFPQNGEVWKGQGDAQLALNKPEEALESYSRALALRSDNVLATLQQSSALLRLNRYQDVVNSMDEFLLQTKNQYYAYYLKSVGLFNLNRIEEAIKTAEEGLSYNRKFGAFYDLASQGYQRLGNENAAQYFQDLKQQNISK